MSNFVLGTIDWKKGKNPSFRELAKKMNVPLNAFDTSYGIVQIDPITNTYCFMVDEKHIDKNGPSIGGPFSNVRIEPFDPEK